MFTQPTKTAQLHQALTQPPTRSQIVFWLSFSLLVAFVYSLAGLQEAFSSDYVIQDDARQHVFWMRRFLDPGLFPNDLMADYFQSVAPWGYATLYRLFAWVGFDPVTVSKLLPPILGLLTTLFCFGVTMQILPLPIAGFAAATLLNQNLWMRDDLSSATPGAFFYPIFLAFLYYLLRRSLVPCLITIALQGLFYPQCVFLSAGMLILQLVDWQDRPKLIRERQQLRFSAIGVGVAFAVMLIYAFKSSQFGSVISVAEAKSLPAFAPTGWSAYFSDNFIDFWLCGKRSGMIPTEWCDLAKDDQERAHWWLALLRFPSLGLGLLLPVLLICRRCSNFLNLSLSHQITSNWQILLRGLLVSLSMFFLAHLLAFKLHLPNRYTEHSFRIFLAIAAGITLIVLWERIFQILQSQKLLATGFTVCVTALLVLYPYSLEVDHEPFPVTGYFRGKHADLYEFFARQPKEIQIASLSEEANLLPTFAKRSLVAGGEGYLLPYHPLYFQQLSQKLLALIQAQYSPDLAQVKAFINQYQVNFWLLDRESFQPEFTDPKAYLTRVFAQFPHETQPIKIQIESGTVSALSQVTEACSAFNRDGFRVLRARCVLRQ